MSVVYTFHEKFKAKNLSKKQINSQYQVEDAVVTMQRQIALLCSQLLCNNGFGDLRHLDIRIELDNKRTEYSWADISGSKGILSAEIQEAVFNIAKAKRIEIDLNYEYVWRAWKDYLSIGPFVMTGLLEECGDEIFDYVDYAMFNHADCGDGAGIVAVYGKQSGAVHRGVVDYSAIKEAPSFGNWYAPQTAVMLEDDVSSEGFPRLVELCNSLMELSSGDDYSFEPDNFYYYMNGALLDTPEKTNKFISVLSELARLLPKAQDVSQDEIVFETEFFDTSETAPNLLKIEVAYSGATKLSAAFGYCLSGSVFL